MRSLGCKARVRNARAEPKPNGSRARTNCIQSTSKTHGRYARICSKVTSSKIKTKGRIDRLKSQGYRIEELRKLSLRFFKDRHELVSRFDIDNGNEFIRIFY